MSRALRVIEQGTIGLFLAAATVLVTASAAAWLPRTPAGRPDPAIHAYAYAMPGRGWAPLTVYFSAYGSTTPAGRPARYEWDLDGDGAFETDATATGGYVEHTFVWAGTQQVNLRVTSASGGYAVATTSVTVRHPAGSSVDYWSLFDDSRVGRIDLVVSRADWARMWAAPEAKAEVEAAAVIFGERVERVGLRMKGNGTLYNSGIKKSWMLDFNAFEPRQDFHSLTALVLNNNMGDTSLLREKLAYDMMHLAGVPAGFTAFADVWLDLSDDDAPPAFLGVYTLVERPDRVFLANRFGRRNDRGNLYKADAFFAQGAADLAYYGPDISVYPRPRGRLAYRKMNNQDEADYADVVDLAYAVDGAAYASPEAWAANLEQVFDADTYLRYLAVIEVNANLDSYPYTGNNYLLYDLPATGRFTWIAWDLNNSWSGFGGTYDFPLYGEVKGVGPLQRAPLFERAFAVERYRRDYRAYVDLLLRHFFDETSFTRRAQAWHDLLAPHVRQSTGDRQYFGPGAPYRVEQFDSGWAELATFTRARYAYLKAALAAEPP